MQNISTTTSRHKLINAIVFFASNTKFCGKIKLFKLLYLMDFEHFSQTGKSITGFEYQAWKFGPVPTDLMEEWEELNADLAQAVRIVEEKVIDYERQAVKVNDGVVFDDTFFSPRQLAIMQALAEKYSKTYSPKMIDVVHEQNGAWDKIWQNGRGSRKPIPYALALADNTSNRDALIEIGAQQHMYQAALLAARQTTNQYSAEY
ncbi:MAG: Panacea domain-containing protein [Methylophilaceae bacterium]